MPPPQAPTRLATPQDVIEQARPLFAVPEFWIEHVGSGALSRGLWSLLLLAAIVLFTFAVGGVLTRLLGRLAEKTRWQVDDELVQGLRGPIARSGILLGVMAALEAFEFDLDSGIPAGRILRSLAVLVWVPYVFRSTMLVLRAASEDPDHFRTLEPRTFPLFDNLAKVALFVAFSYLVLVVVWRLDPSGFLASAGIAGIAIGFAAQDTLSNLFAGVFIIADAPYRVGDFITLDTGERGEVLNIGLRSTRILTRDDIEITIPNAIMGRAKITNEAGGPSPAHRIRVRVSCAYGTDVARVRSALIDCASETEHVLSTPAPRVRFRSFGESGLDFELLCWIPMPVLRGQVLDALHTAVYERFASDGIEIPYPKRDLYLHRVDAPEPPGD
ncbi:MAG TPA: mechanosensitive ion channel family protein [Planctomycetes bacterium]|nr:mechanosensitive ion channel family protein [Planctomycetota bacterium]